MLVIMLVVRRFYMYIPLIFNIIVKCCNSQLILLLERKLKQSRNGLYIMFNEHMKWLRYKRVISLKIQVGNTNQRNKWANTDHWIYGRWGRCLGGVSIPFWSITPTDTPVPWSWIRSYPRSKSVCRVRSNFWCEKYQRTCGSMTVCNYKLHVDHYNGQRTICLTSLLNLFGVFWVWYILNIFYNCLV
jgi:hypothetical protein